MNLSLLKNITFKNENEIVFYGQFTSEGGHFPRKINVEFIYSFTEKNIISINEYHFSFSVPINGDLEEELLLLFSNDTSFYDFVSFSYNKIDFFINFDLKHHNPIIEQHLKTFRFIFNVDSGQFLFSSSLDELEAIQYISNEGESYFITFLFNQEETHLFLMKKLLNVPKYRIKVLLNYKKGFL